MPNYDDFNLDLNKVTSNKNDITTRAITTSVECKIISKVTKISWDICGKTTQGKGCDPSYTKITPCNRTLR